MKSGIAKIIISSCLFLLLQSCNNECDGFVYSTTIGDEKSKVNITEEAYINSPTSDNCRAYREALDTYIEEMESIENCITPTFEDMYMKDLNEAREARSTLNC